MTAVTLNLTISGSACRLIDCGIPGDLDLIDTNPAHDYRSSLKDDKNIISVNTWNPVYLHYIQQTL